MMIEQAKVQTRDAHIAELKKENEDLKNQIRDTVNVNKLDGAATQ